MRINCITSFKSSVNMNKTMNNHPQQVSFGYGEDYGYNPFVDPEFDAKGSDPNLLNCIKYGLKLPFAIVKDFFGKKEKLRFMELERLGYEEELREMCEARDAREGRKSDKISVNREVIIDEDYDDNDFSICNIINNNNNNVGVSDADTDNEEDLNLDDGLFYDDNGYV